MSGIFTEDALIEQPAIRLFKDVLEYRPRIRPRMHEYWVARSPKVRMVFVDGSLWDKITPRI